MHEQKATRSFLMKIQHILVATDFSECSQQALEYAISMGKAFQSKISLLHVLDVPSELSTEAMIRAGKEGPLMSLEDYLRDNCKEQLDAKKKRIHEAGLQADSLVEAGLAYRVILHKAESLGVDLIVVGTHGHTGLKHLFLGSTAERVVRQAPCPVLTIRQKTAA
jgi:nucleotide-binding universal stress UspA family protein